MLNSMKLGGRVRHEPRRNQLHFGVDPSHEEELCSFLLPFPGGVRKVQQRQNITNVEIRRYASSLSVNLLRCVYMHAGRLHHSVHRDKTT